MKPERTGWGLKLAVVFIAFYLVVPTLLVVPMSFSAGSTFQFPPDGWSLRWYARLFTTPEWTESAWTSLRVAAIAAPLAAAVGTAAAFGIARLRSRTRAAALGFVMAPLIVPKILIALAVYGAFLRLRLSGTVVGIGLAHTVLALPYVVVAVTARLQGMDPQLQSAASSLGARPLSAFRRVTMPLAMPGILSGALLAFVTSFDELVTALFLQAPSVTTLPVRMFNSVVYNIDLSVAAASTILVIIVSAVLLGGQLLAVRQKAGEVGRAR